MNKEIKTISELANKLNGYGASKDFLQIMLVYNKIKNGYFPQTNDKLEVKHIFESEITPLLKQLGLYVSFKHGGYVTYDEKKYKSWDGWGFHFKKKEFGSYYLGYPKCCELRFNLFPQLLSFHLYYIVKKILIDKDNNAVSKLERYIEDGIETEEYQSCVIGCPNHHQRAQSFNQVRKQLSALLPKNYVAKYRMIVKNSLLDLLKSINQKHSQNKMRNSLIVLKSKKMREIFRLEEEFFIEIEELIRNPASKRELIAREEAYLKSI